MPEQRQPNERRRGLFVTIFFRLLFLFVRRMFFAPWLRFLFSFLFRRSEILLQILVPSEGFSRAVGGDDDPFSDTRILFEFALGQISQVWQDDLHELRRVFRQLPGEALIGRLGFSESGNDGEQDVERGLKGDDDGRFAVDHPEDRGGGEQLRFPESTCVCFYISEQNFRKKFVDDRCHIPSVLRGLNIPFHLEVFGGSRLCD